MDDDESADDFSYEDSAEEKKAPKVWQHSTMLMEEPENQIIKPKPKEKYSSVAGYNEKRGDFDVEYDHDAEKMISNLEFREDDTTEEINLKMNIISEYNKRLDQRIARKEFILEHRILDLEYQNRLEMSRKIY